MAKFRIDIDSRGKQATIIVSYSGKTIKTIERKRGVLLPEQWAKLWELIPQDLAVMHSLIAISNYPKGLHVEEIETTKSKSLYSQMVAEFLNFYSARYKIKYDFKGKDGKAIKMINNALAKNSSTEEEILIIWKLILARWDSLEEFYQKQSTLTQINSNLNTILVQIKHGKSSRKSQAKHNADDLRESL